MKYPTQPLKRLVPSPQAHFLRVGLSLPAGLLFLMVAYSARADFIGGLAAYDGGDLEVTVEEWTKAADEGDLDAIVALASLHAFGEGVNQNWERAAELYREGAERGHPIAQLNLAEQYRDGLGVNQDLEEALFWFTLSANQGNSYSAIEMNLLVNDLSPEQAAEVAGKAEAWKSR